MKYFICIFVNHGKARKNKISRMLPIGQGVYIAFESEIYISAFVNVKFLLYYTKFTIYNLNLGVFYLIYKKNGGDLTI